MDNPLRVSKYKQQFSKPKMAGFDFTNSVRITDIPEFERSNPSSTFSVYEVAEINSSLSNFKINVDARSIQLLF